MDINAILNDQNLIDFFLKAFAIVLSLLFIVYSIILLRQTQVMTRTLKVSQKGIFHQISFIQIIVALALLILAFILL